MFSNLIGAANIPATSMKTSLQWPYVLFPCKPLAHQTTDGPPQSSTSGTRRTLGGPGDKLHKPIDKGKKIVYLRLAPHITLGNDSHQMQGCSSLSTLLHIPYLIVAAGRGVPIASVFWNGNLSLRRRGSPVFCMIIVILTCDEGVRHMNIGTSPVEKQIKDEFVGTWETCVAGSISALNYLWSQQCSCVPVKFCNKCCTPQQQPSLDPRLDPD